MSRVLVIFIFIVLACPASAEEIEVDMTNSLNKLSYAAGYKIGDMFQNQKLSIVPDAVLKGMYDARKNIRPALTKAEMKLILRDPKKFLSEDIDSLSQKQLKEGLQFLSENAQKEGVVVRDSGLQYSVLVEGTGEKPQREDNVRIHYNGQTLEGHSFVDTYEQGTPVAVSLLNVVPGMSEGLQLMNEGARWKLFMPSSLAYANQGPMAGKTLIFEVELLEVISADK